MGDVDVSAGAGHGPVKAAATKRAQQGGNLAHAGTAQSDRKAASDERVQLWCWRHPAVAAAAGRCIGITDLPLDPRRARRLARRIRTAARAHALPREVWVSPLARARTVGRALRALGFRVHVDERLRELDFGAWDGRAWSAIDAREVQAWSDDLLDYAPGAGESLRALARRVASFVDEARGVRMLVTHGGWLNALRLNANELARLPATDWPAPPRHGTLTRWRHS